jgi:hypothetical protein
MRLRTHLHLPADAPPRPRPLRAVSPRPLPSRILAYLHRHPGPAHYTRIAQHIAAAPLATRLACWRMTKDGRLRWVEEGTYTLGDER